MKRILVTAGGTAIAWHICQICKQYFTDQIEVYVCDTNEPYLVPASTISKKCYKVPYANDSNYLKTIEKIIIENAIDIIVPLIPNELLFLSSDSPLINKLGIRSSSCASDIVSSLSDKSLMFAALNNLDIPTPLVYTSADVEENMMYFVKPKLGFGSLNTGTYSGKQLITNGISNEYVIQEVCDNSEEVTVEVFNGRFLKVFARRRVATKSGVCVKMIPVDNQVFIPIVKKLISKMELPIAFNLQFFRDNRIWKLFDFNLRLGAGTPLATAAGFQLTRAFLAVLIGEKVSDSWFEVDKEIKSVLRVYNEVIIK